MKRQFRDEYIGAALGDERRSSRLQALGEALSLVPAASFPSALGDGAELEAAYRFLSNPAVEADSILGPHYRETVSRCAKQETVVVAHDTTDFVFAGEGRRGLGRMRGTKEQGFFAHTALAVSLDRWREPLGVLNLETWIRPKAKSKASKMSPRMRQKVQNRESRRWLRGVETVEEQFESGHAIHVMDREADMYDLFAAMVENSRRFVVRSTFDRRIEGDTKIAEHLTSKPAAITREVAISKRQLPPLPKQRKIHPPRNPRIATLGLKAQVVSVLRPRDLPETLPKSLTLHVVVVEEIDPPVGEPAVYWRLYTTEPINTVADIEAVVDAYRCRWRIEEFFKALKTGCAIEKRQLETGHALINAVALFTPIAWRVLRLRTLAHADADRPAKRVMTGLQIRILRKQAKKKLPRALTVAEALIAVAALGGHLKRNGPPGWITLSRGYERLLTLEEGAILAGQM